ncbi:hypothetical protein SK128_022553 [Halocaridina rubra]|uniref:Uncharacterized protein n=1 Tax=Halocaridina rubra TaxID=373956 RepID=A0AAN8WHR4_HALRR
MTSPDRSQEGSRRRVRPSLFRLYKVSRLYPQFDLEPIREERTWSKWRDVKKMIKCICSVFILRPKTAANEYKYEITMVLQVLCLLLGLVFYFIALSEYARSGWPPNRDCSTKVCNSSSHWPVDHTEVATSSTCNGMVTVSFISEKTDLTEALKTPSPDVEGAYIPEDLEPRMTSKDPDIISREQKAQTDGIVANIAGVDSTRFTKFSHWFLGQTEVATTPIYIYSLLTKYYKSITKIY